MTPFPARYGIWAAMARETLLGVYGASPYGNALFQGKVVYRAGDR